ncbi:MAG TPA: hypothetical protein G4O00_15015 [Thermoflexia bacterium]|nr:hypothetical protein [Thermoflexia bacterium]
MTNREISLRALIEKVRDELLAPAGGPGYPIFFVDKVELELQVGVSYEAEAGLKISVLQVGGVEVGGGGARERTHTVTVTLSPILSREEQRELLEQDPRLLEGVQRATQAALRKGSTLTGEPE